MIATVIGNEFMFQIEINVSYQQLNIDIVKH